MSERDRSLVQPPRRSVAARILISYALLIAAFVGVAGWSTVSLRRSAEEAELLRAGYLPLSLALRDALADQDAWNTQLNHVTSAANPKDQRVWFDGALAVGRPRGFAKLRAAIRRSLVEAQAPEARRLGDELLTEVGEVERLVEGDRGDLDRLFDALRRADAREAEARRSDLVTRGLRAKLRFSALETRVQGEIDRLLTGARRREAVALRLSVGLSLGTLAVGLATVLWARRVLRPLGRVTERARAVAQGDLTPRPITAANDELGELSETFERMVAAISQANERLVASERLAAIGKMAAHVTHEIRNPLSSMALNVELLAEELGERRTGETQQLLSALEREIERLTALSEQYLSLARQETTLELEEEELGVLVSDALDLPRRELERHGVSLTVDVRRELPRVLVDEARLRQVLLNLVRNAQEAMPQGGTITVRAEHPAGSGFVRLLVEDEGEGIPEALRGRLFEPFFTTKSRGTGLGLAVSRKVAELHGGTLEVEPRSPRGTRFVVTLPVAPPG